MMNTRENEKEIVKALTPYMTVYPTCKLDAVGITIYARALANIPAPVIDAAMRKLLYTSKWFPTVAEIFEAVESLHEEVERRNGNGNPTPAEAWAEVMRCAEIYHVSRPWKFSCEAVKKAAKQFGIYELCSLETEAVNTARAQFMRIYDGILKTAKVRKENERILSMLGDKQVLLLGRAE